MTIPYLRTIAKLGLEKAVMVDSALAKGVNVYQGHVCCEPVAKALELSYVPLDTLIPFMP